MGNNTVQMLSQLICARITWLKIDFKFNFFGTGAVIIIYNYRKATKQSVKQNLYLYSTKQ